MYEEFVKKARNGEILSYRCKKCGMVSIKGNVCPFCGSGELEKETAPKREK